MYHDRRYTKVELTEAGALRCLVMLALVLGAAFLGFSAAFLGFSALSVLAAAFLAGAFLVVVVAAAFLGAAAAGFYIRQH